MGIFCQKSGLKGLNSLLARLVTVLSSAKAGRFTPGEVEVMAAICSVS
jgi:hypothetical protein